MHDHITAAEFGERAAPRIVARVVADDHGRFCATRTGGDGLGATASCSALTDSEGRATSAAE